MPRFISIQAARNRRMRKVPTATAPEKIHSRCVAQCVAATVRSPMRASISAADIEAFATKVIERTQNLTSVRN